MKLSKPDSRIQERCIELLKKDKLTPQEREYVLINYNEGASNNNSVAGAFFTPIGMAFEFSNDVIMSMNGDTVSIIDLCAGIGMLSYAITTKLKNQGIKFRCVCVEYNPEYYEIGKKLIPEAEWYCLDVCDVDEITKLGVFDVAVSNPPFGSVGTFRSKDSPRYKGSQAEYKVIDIAFEVADYGFFLLPQSSSGFRYSGQLYYETCQTPKYKSFMKSTGLELEIGMAIDTTTESMYSWTYDDETQTESNWKNVNPVVEFVNCRFSDFRHDSENKIKTLF